MVEIQEKEPDFQAKWLNLKKKIAMFFAQNSQIFTNIPLTLPQKNQLQWKVAKFHAKLAKNEPEIVQFFNKRIIS